MRTRTARPSLGSERPAPDSGPVVSFEPLLLPRPGHRGKWRSHTCAVRRRPRDSLEHNPSQILDLISVSVH
jgi:hypothetical protein